MLAGDRTEAFLKKLGVTEEKYRSVKEKFGLRPECNCSGRKRKLNDWDEAVRNWWNKQKKPPQDK